MGCRRRGEARASETMNGENRSIARPLPAWDNGRAGEVGSFWGKDGLYFEKRTGYLVDATCSLVSFTTSNCMTGSENNSGDLSDYICDVSVSP